MGTTAAIVIKLSGVLSLVSVTWAASDFVGGVRLRGRRQTSFLVLMSCFRNQKQSLTPRSQQISWLSPSHLRTSDLGVDGPRRRRSRSCEKGSATNFRLAVPAEDLVSPSDEPKNDSRPLYPTQKMCGFSGKLLFSFLGVAARHTPTIPERRTPTEQGLRARGRN